MTLTRRRGRRSPSAHRTVVFVANDVGDHGGMESHAARLVEGLLDTGWHVTVIARTCTLAPHPGLRFLRVAAVRRPFALAFPLFALIGSVLAARRGDALLHTAGAIIANSADVSTVHYCHAAARAAIPGGRASRSLIAYRLNAAVGGWLARAGESWCYSPRRTRLLCPVSSGVARELEEKFPKMTGRVRTIANGVDSEAFRPDSVARRDVRSTLGINECDHIALFVGGDWPRKGLHHAVDALPLAQSWHLAVAGSGDRKEIGALAARAGTERRVHFLGSVADMPRLYAAADAFVFPTSYEAFPLSMLEAAACAVPLLVTRVNGAEDFLIDGINGWFIEPDGRDIAGRLDSLAADATLAGEMGAAARLAAKRFDWGTTITEYSAAYAALAADSGT